MFFKSIRERLFGSPEEQFWKWFQANEAILYDFEKNQKTITNILTKTIRKVHSDLMWEISAKHNDGKREFVISADGLKNVFPAVEALYKYAPHLSHWIILKYRPRGSVDVILEYRGKQIDGKAIKYLLIRDENPNKVGIILFIPHFSLEEQDVFYGAGALFLDQAIGEYDAVTRIGTLDIFSTDSEHHEQAKSLCELPNQFDQYISQIN